MNGTTTVLFLLDDDLNHLFPLRIPYHPGVVLEVIPADNGQSESMPCSIQALIGPEMDTEVPSPPGITQETRHSITFSDKATSAQLHSGSSSQHSTEEPSDLVLSRSGGNSPHHGQPSQLPHRLGQILMSLLKVLSCQRIHQLQQSDPQLGQQIEEVKQQANALLQLGQEIEEVKQRANALLQRQRTEQQVDQQVTQKEKTCCENEKHLQKSLKKRGQGLDWMIASRARVILETCFREIVVPRLFIVLPNSNQDREAYRLYYLCECGDHTTKNDGKEKHVIHLADHPGYDVDNFNAFFFKYGPYLLAMMYMIKYGAKGSGRVVPPSKKFKLGLEHQHLDHPKGRFQDMIDDMITKLRASDKYSKMDSLCWLQGATELARLTTYLKTKGAGDMYGNLHRATTQEQHVVWICGKHGRRHNKSSMRKFKKVVIANGGEYSEQSSRVTITITSDPLTKWFLEAIRGVQWIQYKSQSVLTALDLTLGCEHSAAHAVLDLNFIESLTLDFGRFSFIVGISEDNNRYVEIKIDRLGDLTSQDLMFILMCHHDQLLIMNTPQREDEVRLHRILRQSHNLEILRIGCHAARSLGVLDSILSAREMAVRSGLQFPLRTLEMMGEGLSPFINYTFSKRDHVDCTVTFPVEGKNVTMTSRVMLRASSKNDPALNFVRKYSHTIDTLTAYCDMTDDRVEILLEAIQDKRLNLTTFNFDPVDLTTRGLETMDNIIKRMPKVSIGMRLRTLNSWAQLDNAKLLLKRYRNRLYSLQLSGSSSDYWMPHITAEFPTRDMFPKLRSLIVGGARGSFVSRDHVQWLIGMASAPPSPQPILGPVSAMQPHKSWTALQSLRLGQMDLRSEDWAAVLQTIHLGDMESLHVRITNFSEPELELIIRRTMKGPQPDVILPDTVGDASFIDALFEKLKEEEKEEEEEKENMLMDED